MSAGQGDYDCRLLQLVLIAGSIALHPTQRAVYPVNRNAPSHFGQWLHLRAIMDAITVPTRSAAASISL